MYMYIYMYICICFFSLKKLFNKAKYSYFTKECFTKYSDT